MSRARTALVLALVVGGGVAIRSWELGARSLWFDEAVSVTSISRFGFVEMIDRTAQAVHPPLYYVLLRGWSQVFGISEVGLRSFSVTLAALTIVGTYLFCRDAFAVEMSGEESYRRERGAALLSAAVVALNASQIEWAQQARMYMLGTCLAAFSSWCLVRGLRLGGNPRWWAGWAIFALALTYTHNFGLFTVLAQILYAIGLLLLRHGGSWAAWARCSDARGLLIGTFAVCAGYAPWLPVLRQQSSRVRDDYWIGRFHAWTLPNAWCDLFVPRNDMVSPSWWLSLTMVALTLGILAILIRQRARGGTLIALLVLVPIGVSGAVSATAAPIVVSRYFVFAHLFALAAVGQVAWHGLPPEIRVALGGLILSVEGSLWFDYHEQLAVAERPGLRGVVRSLLVERRGDEPVIVLHPAIFHATRYYVGDAAPVHLYATESLSHYNGGPLLCEGDVWNRAALDGYNGRSILVLDSTGYRTSFARFALPGEWRREEGSLVEYPEVYAFQGEIFGGRYVRSDWSSVK
jgi:mannosyltransferase